MKNKVTLIIITLILTISISASAVEIKDVSKDHWAYQSITELVNRGLFSLYEDGTFRGQDKVSRYELAEIVARILENIDNGGTNASVQDIDLIRQLSNEFREELVQLAKQGDYFQNRIQELEDKNTVQDEYLVKTLDQDISTLNQEIEVIKNEMASLQGTYSEDLLSTNADLNIVSEQVSNLEKEVSRIIDSIIKITQLEQAIEELQKKEIEQDNNLAELAKRINENEDRIAAQAEDFKSMEVEVNEDVLQDLKDENTIMQTRINQLQKEVNKLRNMLSAKDNQVEDTGTGEAQDPNMTYIIGGIAALALLLSLGG